MTLFGIILPAYLDPGTGSYIIQMAVAALASMAFVMKMYWHKFKGLFSRSTGSPDSNLSDD